MSSKIKRLSSFLNKLGLSKEAEETGVLLNSDEDELPKRFPLAFRYWIRDSHYKHNINQTYSPKWKGITANSLFKKETSNTKMKIYQDWKLIEGAGGDKTEQANPVQIKFPDDIPIEFLEKGDEDPEISGFVYPEEDRQRAGIYSNNKLVGFMTPREEPGKGWRIGAIYIEPDNRNKGIGSKAINKFFEERDSSTVPIGTDNIASQKAFINAGFDLLDPDEVFTDKKDGWEYQIWGREKAQNIEDRGLQLDLFGSLRPDMIERIQKLSSWLLENKFQEEAFSALALMKLAAGKPMPINEAEVENTVDELLTELHAKFLAYPQLSPFELYGVLAGRFSLDDAKIPPIIDDPTDEQALEIEAVRQIYEANLPRKMQIEYLESLANDLKEINPELYKNLTTEHLEEQYVSSQEQPLVNYLASNITKKKKDIKGDDITVTYRLLFSHMSEKPPGVTMYGADSSEKDVIIGFNPNSSLIAVVQNYIDTNGEAFDIAQGNIPAEIEFFKKSIRPYLISVLTHEEVHVVDVINKDPRHGEVYKVSHSDGETIEEIAKKLNVEAHSLFVANLMAIVNEASAYANPMVITRAITELVSGEKGAIDSIFNEIKSQKLKKDFELRVPPRSHSQVRVDKLRGLDSETRSDERVRTRSLQEIADETDLKHGVMRLIVVNFNNIFAGSLRINGSIVGMAPSYQNIYELMQTRPEMMQELANAKLPEGTEVKLVPSYSELYAYDRGFYLLTKEEGKAFVRQIMSDIKYKIEKDDSLTIEKVQEMSMQDMMKISSEAMNVEAHLQINPVDKILKTPIGYMDKLKKQRLKLFYSGMRHVHAMLGNEESNDSSDAIS